MSTAIDLAQPITEAMAEQMVAAGVAEALRYLSNNAAKNLSLPEARMLTTHAITMAVVWEAQGNEYSAFTAAQGLADAHRALLEASALTIPAGRTLYFCGADFDASDDEIAGGCADYMRAVNSVVGLSGYLVGVYGNGALCAYMLDNSLAAKAWLWGAGATNGTPAFLASGRWSIHQKPTARMFGASVDPDETQGDFGGFLLTAVTPAAPASAAIPTAQQLQMALTSEGYYRGGIDGIWGPGSQAALAAHFRG